MTEFGDSIELPSLTEPKICQGLLFCPKVRCAAGVPHVAEYVKKMVEALA